MIEVQTPNGTYKLKPIVGRVAVAFLSIFYESDEALAELDAEELARKGSTLFAKKLAFMLPKFYDKILREIYVEGPFKVDEMPPEDIEAIFSYFLARFIESRAKAASQR